MNICWNKLEDLVKSSIKVPVVIGLEAGWTLWSVWMRMENLVCARVWFLDHPPTTLFMSLQRNVMEAVAETNNEENMQHTKDSFERHGILRATTFVLEGLSLVFGFMYDNNMQHIWDYYVVVCKNSVVGSTAKNVSDNNLGVCTCLTLCVQVLCKYMRVFKKCNCKILGASYSCSSNADCVIWYQNFKWC